MSKFLPKQPLERCPNCWWNNHSNDAQIAAKTNTRTMPKLLLKLPLKRCPNCWWNNHLNDAQIVKITNETENNEVHTQGPCTPCKISCDLLALLRPQLPTHQQNQNPKIRCWRSSSSQLRKIVRESVLDTNLVWYCLSRITILTPFRVNGEVDGLSRPAGNGRAS